MADTAGGAGAAAAPEPDQFSDKDKYIKYVAAQLLAMSDFGKNSPYNLVNQAVNNATLLANKFNW